MIRQFGPAGLLTAVALVVAGTLGGVRDLALVTVLGVLEVSLSFDNAVVNAKVLTRMHPVWQKLFLTVGILVAVVGMRLVLPVLIVSVTSHLSVPDVVSLAVRHPADYGSRLAGAKEAIDAFGGTFLLMIFLDFVFDLDRKVFWLARVERALARVGRLNQLSVVLALGAVLLATGLVDHRTRTTVLVAGLLGLLSYLVVHAVDSLFEDAVQDPQDEVGTVALKAGVVAFLYLELLDASFSVDGVVGAFAISDKVLVIALGLGVGALWVRSLTVHLVRTNALSRYVYLEHGAHWAIGVLAVIMLVQVRWDVPEAVTGLTGVVFVGLALLSSVLERRRSP